MVVELVVQKDNGAGGGGGTIGRVPRDARRVRRPCNHPAHTRTPCARGGPDACFAPAACLCRIRPSCVATRAAVRRRESGQSRGTLPARRPLAAHTPPPRPHANARNAPFPPGPGEIEVFNAYRVQHNNSRGPFKGGIKFHQGTDLTDIEGCVVGK